MAPGDERRSRKGVHLLKSFAASSAAGSFSPWLPPQPAASPLLSSSWSSPFAAGGIGCRRGHAVRSK